MSIINDHAGVNRALQELQPHKSARSNGRPICRKCYCNLGQLSVGAVVECKNCSAINRMEE